MKKRKKTMLSLLIILGVLFLCYFVIGRMQENQETEIVEEAVYATEIGEITAIKYDDGASAMSFVKTDDTWYYEADTTIALEQSVIESMASTFGKIVAVRVIEEPDDLEDYGLEEPIYTIVLEDASGDTTTIYVGDEIDGYYYLTVGDKEVVYTVSSSVVSAMEFDIETLEEVEETEEETTTEETE